jgi:predicted DNA-binding transcriptional regulator AlpA
MTELDRARRAILDRGGLASVTGLARIMGVSRARVGAYSRMPGFPEPVPVDGSGRVWFIAEVLEWRRRRLAA